MKKKEPLDIGNLVKDYRLSSGMTQLDLAKKLGYDGPQFVSLFERGLSKIPIETLGQLIVFLGIPEVKIRNALLESYKTEVLERLANGKKIAIGG